MAPRSSSSKYEKSVAAAAAALSPQDSNKKKMKKSPASGAPSSSSQPKKFIKPIWSDEDVIVILDGMIKYAAKNGGEPAAVDKTALHDSVKDSLHFNASLPQLRDKAKKLKKKIPQQCQGKDV
ncbi:hypothetical protein TIFTF001_026072 [Ficus carica]|uniref:Glabrous enhancer-binding protein-like DBD domain-containing protein n=1 Tax=Ficus carica TaxID=3494 RepID=A0AA88APZ0_FICCA|nr:hypothetical protein TIFTF001_026072 [Ficus carica]